MNNYEDVYRFKNENSEDLFHEVSSLNNNYEMDEHQISLQPFSSLFEDLPQPEIELFENDFGDSTSQLSEKDKDMAFMSGHVSTGQSSISCVCVRCQKDLGIEDDGCAKFWQKGNKLRICRSAKSSTESADEDSVSIISCKPVDLDEFLNSVFEITTQNNDIEVLNNEIKDLEAWAESLNTADRSATVKSPEPEDIVLDSVACNIKPKVSDKIESSEITEKLAEKINNANLAGCQEYAALYSWSQYQAFSNALVGKVEESTIKGTSDKDVNALTVRRTCFRALSSHYKNTFSRFNRAWQDKRRNKKKTKDMNEFIDTYIRQEFGSYIDTMPEDFYFSLREAMIAVLHSHRYKKQEEFTKDIDFSIIRDCLYSYTLDARDRFLSTPAYALIYHNFYVSGAYKYLLGQVQLKTKLHVLELEQELVTLHKDAIKTLH